MQNRPTYINCEADFSVNIRYVFIVVKTTDYNLNHHTTILFETILVLTYNKNTNAN